MHIVDSQSAGKGGGLGIVRPHFLTAHKFRLRPNAGFGMGGGEGLDGAHRRARL